MKLPKTVKIGAHHYKVISTVDLKNVNDEPLYGSHNISNLTIHIDEQYPRTVVVEVLLHEMMHGLFDHFGFKQNEKIVDCVSRGVLMLMKDNPGMFQDMIKELK